MKKLSYEGKRERIRYILDSDVETILIDSLKTKWIHNSLESIMIIKKAQYLEQLDRKVRFQPK